MPGKILGRRRKEKISSPPYLFREKDVPYKDENIFENMWENTESDFQNVLLFLGIRGKKDVTVAKNKSMHYKIIF